MLTSSGYDFPTGKFDVPPVLSQDNAKAIVPERTVGTNNAEADSQLLFKLGTGAGAFGRV
jgi:hypothetical protein